MIKAIAPFKGDCLAMKSVKVVFAAAVVTAVGFARADATTESRTAGAVVRFGVVTDLHCADLDTADHTRFVPVAGKTHYRESLRKLEKAVNGTADETNSFAEVAVYPSGDVSVTEFRGGEAELAKGTVPPLRIRQVRFDVGARRPFSVLHVSDSHLTGVDERDGPAVRAFARSRENLGRELGASYLEEALGYARARGLRVVHTGDVIEYASAANFSRAGELVRANDILACVGNHEFWKTGKSWDEAAKRPLAESVGAAFPGEQPAFSCETNGVSLFVFDNAFGRVSPAVTSAFERVVAKGLPVVLVCHVPFPAKELLDRPSVRDYLLGEGAAGTDATTKAFVPRVRNEPLVRAVLCGHLHEFSHTRFSPTAEMCVANALFNGEAVEVTFR